MKHTLYSCLICGHEFRGASDLRRHQNAITLLHRASLNKSIIYSHKCTRCSWYFRSKDNLQQHLDLNLDICVESNRPLSPRTVKLHNIVDDDESIHEKSQETNMHFSSIPLNSSTRRRTSQSEKINLIASINSSNDNTIISGNNVLGLRQSPRYHHDNPIKIEEKPTEVKRKTVDTISIPASPVYKSKKPKVLIPRDRRAFFSVVSLLIDQNLVPDGVMIDGNNFESYIPENKLPFIEKLKSVLSFEC